MFAAFDVQARGFLTVDDLRAVFAEIAHLNLDGTSKDKSEETQKENDAYCKKGIEGEAEEERGAGGVGVVRDAVIEEIFAMADVRGDGRVGFREFQRIMMMTKE